MRNGKSHILERTACTKKERHGSGNVMAGVVIIVAGDDGSIYLLLKRNNAKL